ncbi:protein of unknown function [Rhizobium sp. RU20A]|uniref:DUF4169 family protein n=1 Tax=Rhizobium sp. RU20A TaxID=1907412 RepID=UPI000956BCF3|nr:DUF4169 family protein [Rhizobium sp. RU20A]SIQ19729.1 protein of unknown function [Rhizobium sp. RU20A]
MAAEIINLRMARKQKARADKERAADANRAAHGRTKAEKTLTRALKDQADKRLDQGRLEGKPDAGEKNDG